MEYQKIVNLLGQILQRINHLNLEQEIGLK